MCKILRHLYFSCRKIHLDNEFYYWITGFTTCEQVLAYCLIMKKYFRNLFFNFHYFSTFASIAVGMVSCLLRIVKSLAFGLWTIPRLDVSTLNRYFERFDPGLHKKILAMLLLEQIKPGINSLKEKFSNLIRSIDDNIKIIHRNKKSSRDQVFFILYITDTVQAVLRLAKNFG